MEGKLNTIITALDIDEINVYKTIENGSSVFNTMTEDVLFCKRPSGKYNLLIKESVANPSKVLEYLDKVGINYMKLPCDEAYIYELKLKENNIIVSIENFASTKNIVELLKMKYGNNSCGYVKNSPADVAEDEISVAKDEVDIQGKKYPCLHLVMGRQNNNLDVRSYCENLLDRYALKVGPYMYFVPNELKNKYLEYNGGKEFWYDVARSV
jgi:hypothetical protein